MLKRTIDADAYNNLPDDVKSHYVKRGSKYIVDLEGTDPELQATQTELDGERRKNIELASQVRTLSTEATAVEERVRKESEEKITALTTTNERLTGTAISTELNKHVDAIASLFTVPELISSNVKSRIDVQLDKDGNVVTTYKNAKGEAVDAKTLTEEYCKNPAYSAILKGKENTQSFQQPNQQQQNPAQQQQNQHGASGGFNYANATTAEIAKHLTQTVN